MGATENVRDSINLIITMVVFLLFIGIFFIWSYNFIAISDDKLFDDNNKYINQSLSNPDVESNYKNTYKNKIKMDSLQLDLLNWFGGVKGIFIIGFTLLLLLSLIFKFRKTILDNLKGMFD